MSETSTTQSAFLPTPGARFRAWCTTLLNDHGFLRLAYRNFFEVAPGVYRSNQPLPAHVRRAADLGVRTIINLRGGGSKGFHLLEKDACAAAGIRLMHFSTRSRHLPPRRAFHDARRLFETADYPILLHCKSGADRVGFMAALYLLIHEGRPSEEAQQQLHWKYGHYRQSKTGVLDHFFEAYAAHRARTGEDFFTWIDKTYDPVALRADFHANRWVSLLVDRVLMRE